MNSIKAVVKNEYDKESSKSESSESGNEDLSEINLNKRMTKIKVIEMMVDN
jgi:hypothetical protein